MAQRHGCAFACAGIVYSWRLLTIISAATDFYHASKLCCEGDNIHASNNVMKASRLESFWFFPEDVALGREFILAFAG